MVGSYCLRNSLTALTMHLALMPNISRRTVGGPDRGTAVTACFLTAISLVGVKIKGQLGVVFLNVHSGGFLHDAEWAPLHLTIVANFKPPPGIETRDPRVLS
uniref:Uncharacterized protein n=1 Tax=Cacopsylla melanoneura TaxID=428564 RepID=A0A8D9FB95_9HEMI